MAVYLAIGLVWMVGSACVAIALGRSAARADQESDAHYADLLVAQERFVFTAQAEPRGVATATPRRGDLFARQARTAVRARHSWVYASPSAHAALSLTGACGPDASDEADGAPLRAAGMAVNGDQPVVLPLVERTLVAVPVPFADGRIGAIVVAGAAGLAQRAHAPEHVRRVAARFAAYEHERTASPQVQALGRVGAQ
jgi:hypothetical protein